MRARIWRCGMLHHDCSCRVASLLLSANKQISHHILPTSSNDIQISIDAVSQDCSYSINLPA